MVSSEIPYYPCLFGQTKSVPGIKYRILGDGENNYYESFKRVNLFNQGGDHGLGVETFEVWVGLPGAHKHNGLATDVSHRNCRADLEKTRAHQTQIML